MKSQYIKIICMQFISTIKIEKLSLNQILFQIEQIFYFTHVHKHNVNQTQTRLITKPWYEVSFF